MDKSLYKGIWVFAEQRNGQLDESPLELLAKANELKEVNGDEITALLLGSDVAPLAEELIAYGADRVIVVDNENLKEYKTVPYAEAAVQAIEKYKPSIFLLGATVTGRDLGPRIMAKLGTGLTADCLDLSLDEDGTLIQTKPSYGGNIMCTILIPEHRPQMATVRPKVFTKLERDDARQGEIIAEHFDVADDTSYEIVKSAPKEKSGASIDKADIIVAGGRGLKQKEDLNMLQELADLIGGQVGCSRPLVDDGWMTHDDQIG